MYLTLKSRVDNAYQCAHRFAGNALDWPTAKAAADQIRSRGVEVTCQMHAIFPN